MRDKFLCVNTRMEERVTFVRTIKIKKKNIFYLFYMYLFGYELKDKRDIRTGNEKSLF